MSPNNANSGRSHGRKAGEESQTNSLTTVNDVFSAVPNPPVQLHGRVVRTKGRQRGFRLHAVRTVRFTEHNDAIGSNGRGHEGGRVSDSGVARAHSGPQLETFRRIPTEVRNDSVVKGLILHFLMVCTCTVALAPGLPLCAMISR